MVGDPGPPVATDVAEAIADGFAADLHYVSLATASMLTIDGGAGETDRITELKSAALAEPVPIDLVSIESEGRGQDLSSYYAVSLSVFFLFFTVQFGVLSLVEEREGGTLDRRVLYSGLERRPQGEDPREVSQLWPTDIFQPVERRPEPCSGSTPAPTTLDNRPNDEQRHDRHDLSHQDDFGRVGGRHPYSLIVLELIDTHRTGTHTEAAPRAAGNVLPRIAFAPAPASPYGCGRHDRHPVFRDRLAVHATHSEHVARFTENLIDFAHSSLPGWSPPRVGRGAQI